MVYTFYVFTYLYTVLFFRLVLLTLVKEALETVRFLDVEDWAAQVFGQSMFSKRRILFSAATDDTETA
ncbi:hypothetical protein A6770_39160 [Nostoc minutum NIES-26]|uniref:Uncharacterized protein n=1 Tax=Nostoc minutum NIES-26 TaxID=1844469 RepID=A0A367RR72_9NOSO|nr:hypothetical protein A6770_39160 [Nostoc minutum NIES-26]